MKSALLSSAVTTKRPLSGALVIVTVSVTSVAALKLSVCARLARIVQSPAFSIVTVLSATVQTSGVSELKVTSASAFVSVALTVKLPSV